MHSYLFKSINTARYLCLQNLFAIILMGTSITYTYGQYKYDPILKDGKLWNYRFHNYNTGLDRFYCLEIAGDSLFEGISCKKILHVQNGDSNLYTLMYEDDRRLYNRNGDSWELWYDFNLEIGDEISYQGTEYYVDAIDTIDISGYKRLRLHFGLKDNEFHKGSITWIEGIGNGNGLLQPFAYYSDSNLTFLSCYEEGRKIFSGRFPACHIWEYTYLKDWKIINNTVFGEKVTQGYMLEEYDSEPVAIGNHSYLIIKAIGKSEQPAGYPLGVREEKGRVFVNYEAYLKHLYEEHEPEISRFPMGDPDYIPYYITEEGEIVLYDYNMEVGDAYRHVEGHEDVIVVQKDSVRLKDMEFRRRLILSNGLVLIEGLGCTNSPGMFFDYLNPAEECQLYFCSLTFYNYFYGSEGSIYQSEWAFEPNGIDDIYEFIGSKVQERGIYDLQGRKLQKAPTKGIYIQDRKKRVIK